MEMVQKNLRAKPERMQLHCEQTGRVTLRSGNRIALAYAATPSLLVGSDFAAHGPPSG